MYDLWQSSVFSQTDKQNIHDICFGSQYSPLQNNELSPSLDDLITQAEKDVEKAQRGSLVVPNGQIDKSSQKELFLNYTTAASDNMVRYTWDKQDYDIKSAYVYLSKALNIYDQHSPEIELISPLLGVALVDMYQNNKKDSYLTLAKKIYTAHSGTNCSALDSCIHSLFLAESLSSATGDNSYMQQFKKIRDYMINNYFDYPGYKGLKFNKGAFYSPGVNAIYPVMYNGLVIELLLQ
jgi:hypothetical protein